MKERTIEVLLRCFFALDSSEPCTGPVGVPCQFFLQSPIPLHISPFSVGYFSQDQRCRFDLSVFCILVEQHGMARSLADRIMLLRYSTMQYNTILCSCGFAAGEFGSGNPKCTPLCTLTRILILPVGDYFFLLKSTKAVLEHVWRLSVVC
jgi:hypothetical protein